MCGTAAVTRTAPNSSRTGKENTDADCSAHSSCPWGTLP